MTSIMRFAFGAALAASFLFAQAASARCRDNVVDVRTSEGGAIRFSVEIADTPEMRAQGLMHRTDLPESAGMLFVFDPPQMVSFWMKNTPLPLDIIFVDESGVVSGVAARTTPFSEDSIPSDGEVRAVLEINGGLSDRYGIGPGAELRHPAIDHEIAAWPCE